MHKLDETQQLPPLSLLPQMPQPYSSLVQVIFGSATHAGKIRKSNEDSYLVFRVSRRFERLECSLPGDQIPPLAEEVGFVMAVADGMGGTQGGEVASALALRAAVAAILEAPNWILKLDPATGRENLIEHLLKRGVSYFKAAHDAILRLAEAGAPNVNRMGTTLTATYSNGHDLFIMHVGDSRAYLYRRGELRLLTRDHTLVQELLESGKITPEQATHHRLSHVLTRAISAQTSEIKIEIDTLRLEDGDQILLCTDGLSSMIEASTIAAILARQLTPPETCQELLESALQAGGRDNITVVIGRYHLPPDPRETQPTLN
ncbi:MAG: protein phosphatase 2C domain-containing protein [Gemmataceae bacterium]